MATSTMNSTTTTRTTEYAAHNKSLYWGIAAAVIVALGIIWAVMAYRGRTDVPVSTAPTSQTTTPSADVNAVTPPATDSTVNGGAMMNSTTDQSTTVPGNASDVPADADSGTTTTPSTAP